MNGRNDDKEHLPLFGVGPIIVYGQFVITAAAIVLSYLMKWDFAKNEVLSIPLKVLGVFLIIFGFYLDISAKYKSKLFDRVAENKLITDGVYAIVRNPVYGGMLIVCTGTVMIANNFSPQLWQNSFSRHLPSREYSLSLPFPRSMMNCYLPLGNSQPSMER